MPLPPLPIDLDEAAFRAEEAGVPPRAFAEIIVVSKIPLLLGKSVNRELSERLSGVRSLRFRPGNSFNVDGNEYTAAKIDWPAMVAALRACGAPGAERLRALPPVIIPPPPSRQASPEWWTAAHFEAARPAQQPADPGEESEPEMAASDQLTPITRGAPLPPPDQQPAKAGLVAAGDPPAAPRRRRRGPKKGETDAVRRQQELLIPVLKENRGDKESRTACVRRLVGAGKISLPGSANSEEKSKVDALVKVWGQMDK